MGRDVGQKDSHLTVLDLARGSAVLHLGSRRLVASFGKAGLVDHHNGLLVAHLLQHVASQVVTHQISIPDGTGEQALHAVGSGFSGLFGQLPPIFALDGTQQALQVAERPTSGFRPGKAGSNPRMQPAKGLLPLHDVSECRSGSERYGMLVLRHGLLLSLAVSEGGFTPTACHQ
jgi:hypothetical protein